MTLEELNGLYEAKEQIGLTKDQLHELNISNDKDKLKQLGEYPKKMEFFVKVPPQALEMDVPESNLTPVVRDDDGNIVSYTKLKDACTPITIEGQIYIRIGVMDASNGRTLPVCSDEFYTWLDNFGINNVVKELPITEEI